jgi:hypothetical protein
MSSVVGSDNRLLRYYYQTLKDYKDFVNSILARGFSFLDEPAFGQVVSGIEELQAIYPGLIPRFTRAEVARSTGSGDAVAVQLYLKRALTRLELELEGEQDTPTIESREFAFVTKPELRRLLERDYPEIQRAYVAGCWKAVVILSGGALEAILLDQLLKDIDTARSASSAPHEPDITRWNLSSLIAVCVEMGTVQSGLDKLSHSIREYRNLVHPGVEIRTALVFGKEEARIALEVLHILHRDLSV